MPRTTATRTPKAACVYCRISLDRKGEEAGVERQEIDCRDLAARLGWPVAEVYVDNDLTASRFSKKKRPAFERMLDDLREGHRDAVIVLDEDRLVRRMDELESFISLADTYGVQLANVQGEVDLATADGRLKARIKGSVSAHESDKKSERIRDQRRHAAAKGLPHPSPRPFGYSTDGMSIIPERAEIVRELVRRYIAGESMYSLAKDLNARGVTTARGKAWSTQHISKLLTSPTIAGLRVYQGEVVGQGVWPAIITVSEHERIVARAKSGHGPKRGRPAVHLLTGLLTCGGIIEADGQPCGAKLYSGGVGKVRGYACRQPVGSRGCAKVGVAAHHVERVVTEDVLGWLESTPAVEQGWRSPGEEATDTGPLFEALSAGQAKLDELAELYAEDQITKAQLLAACEKLRARMDATRDAIRRSERGAVSALVPPGVALRDVWEASDVAWRRELLRAVTESIVVVPVGHVGGKFREDRVRITYR